MADVVLPYIHLYFSVKHRYINKKEPTRFLRWRFKRRQGTLKKTHVKRDDLLYCNSPQRGSFCFYVPLVRLPGYPLQYKYSKKSHMRPMGLVNLPTLIPSNLFTGRFKILQSYGVSWVWMMVACLLFSNRKGIKNHAFSTWSIISKSKWLGSTPHW